MREKRRGNYLQSIVVEISRNDYAIHWRVGKVNALIEMYTQTPEELLRLEQK